LSQSAADSFPKLSATEDFAERCFCKSRALPINAGTGRKMGHRSEKNFSHARLKETKEFMVQERRGLH